MEELRSTEVLDREILEDARKKAFKILKPADDTVESQQRRWEKRTQKAINEIRKTYERNTQKVQEEILARGPLDRRRLRSETAENFLLETMDIFLANLSRKDLLSILEGELQKRLELCEDLGDTEEGKYMLSYSAMDEAEAEEIFNKVINRTENNKKTAWEKQNTPGAVFPAMVLDTPEIKISASVENAARDILKDKRAELTVSLLGEGALND